MVNLVFNIDDRTQSRGVRVEGLRRGVAGSGHARVVAADRGLSRARDGQGLSRHVAHRCVSTCRACGRAHRTARTSPQKS